MQSDASRRELDVKSNFTSLCDHLSAIRHAAETETNVSLKTLFSDRSGNLGMMT
jgi:hypothetical protein